MASYSAFQAMRRMMDASSQSRQQEDDTSNMGTPFLVRFYDASNPSPDPFGRTLSKMLSWPDERLEMCHDYIQFLFPLPEGSPFNMMAPPVDQRVYEAFRDDIGLRSNLRRSLDRMLLFYGFIMTSTESEVKVTRHPNWRESFGNWVRRFDHNHLRITRVLRSLRVLGLEQEARAFYDALKSVQDQFGLISEKSLGFWTRAVVRPLRLAPDERDDALGVRWLRNIEKAEAKKQTEADRRTEEQSPTSVVNAGEPSDSASRIFPVGAQQDSREAEASAVRQSTEPSAQEPKSDIRDMHPRKIEGKVPMKEADTDASGEFGVDGDGQETTAPTIGLPTDGFVLPRSELSLLR